MFGLSVDEVKNLDGLLPVLKQIDYFVKAKDSLLAVYSWKGPGIEFQSILLLKNTNKSIR